MAEPLDPGKRIEHIWVFVARDEDGDEGLPAFTNAEGVMLPMVASDERRRDALLSMAEEMCRRGRVRIELRRFDGPFVLEQTFDPF